MRYLARRSKIYSYREPTAVTIALSGQSRQSLFIPYWSNQDLEFSKY
jgi:hypothetical protein